MEAGAQGGRRCFFKRTIYLGACVGLMIAGCSRDSTLPLAQSTSPSGSPAVAKNTTAGSEKVLNVYNWTGFIEPSVISAFEKEFGIKVHYDVYETNEMMEVKLLSGHTAYDIVVPGGSFFESELKAGVYAET